jgi:SM-20-related protein
MIADMDTAAEEINLLCQNLRTQAWSVSLQGFFSEELLHAMHLEANAHELANHLSPTRVRHLALNAVSPRSDTTLWLDDPRCGTAAKDFLKTLDILRLTLNEKLTLGLTSTEAHFANYAPGASYDRHHDRFKDNDARVLSLVCYLNLNWPEDAGGELRLHLPEGIHDISPERGTVVVFLSDEIEHEVLPTAQSRHSIAAWFHQQSLPSYR